MPCDLPKYEKEIEQGKTVRVHYHSGLTEKRIDFSKNIYECVDFSENGKVFAIDKDGTTIRIDNVFKIEVNWKHLLDKQVDKK